MAKNKANSPDQDNGGSDGHETDRHVVYLQSTLSAQDFLHRETPATGSKDAFGKTVEG